MPVRKSPVPDRRGDPGVGLREIDDDGRVVFPASELRGEPGLPDAARAVDHDGRPSAGRLFPVQQFAVAFAPESLHDAPFSVQTPSSLPYTSRNCNMAST